MVRGDSCVRTPRSAAALWLASSRPRPDTPPIEHRRRKRKTGGGSVRSSVKAVAFVGLFAALAFVAAGCGGGGNESSSGATTTSGGGGGGNVTALPASACSSIYYEGDGSPDYIVASDLPLQGAGQARTPQMV